MLACTEFACPQDGRASLHLAAYQGHMDLVSLLLTNGADVKARTIVRPHSACSALDWSLTSFALQEDWTALHAAADKGHKEVVTLLLDSGADPRSKGKVRPISEACRSDLALTASPTPARPHAAARRRGEEPAGGCPDPAAEGRGRESR